MIPIPVQITFHRMPRSAGLERDIRDHVSRMASSQPRLQRCRVVVGRPHRHRHVHPCPVQVGLELGRRGAEPVIVRQSVRGRRVTGGVLRRRMAEGLGAPCRDAYDVVHEAFAVARRRLHDRAPNRRGR
jgi:hypothetical protein